MPGPRGKEAIWLVDPPVGAEWVGGSELGHLAGVTSAYGTDTESQDLTAPSAEGCGNDRDGIMMKNHNMLNQCRMFWSTGSLLMGNLLSFHTCMELFKSEILMLL